MVDLLPDEQLADVDVGLAPRPEEVPGTAQRTAVGQLLPFLPAQEASGDDVVHLFLGLDHSVVAIVGLVELPVQIAVEDLQSFHQLLQVDIGVLGVEEELLGVAELEVVGGVEGQEDCGLEVAGLVLEVLLVGGEHVGQVLHDHRDVLQRLVLRLRVHH